MAFDENGVTAEEADAYLKPASAELIVKLHEKKIAPGAANKYLERFMDDKFDIASIDGEKFIELIELCVSRNISPAVMYLYWQNYGGLQGALALIKASIPPDVTASYQGFNGADIAFLIKAGITPDVAQKFPASLDGETIAACWRQGVVPGDVDNEFFIRFDGPEIKSLLTDSIPVPVSQALAYPSRFSGHQIKRFVEIGLGPDDADASDLEKD